jgi:hypothetical protein
MGPCPRCGQQTEADADFCPACTGYPAPATVYSYAPGRHSQSWDEAPAPRLTDAPGTPRGRHASDVADHALRAADLASRLEIRPGSRHSGRWIALVATLCVVVVAAGSVALALAGRSRPGSTPPAAGATHAGRSASPAARSTPAAARGGVAVAPAAAGAPHQAAVLSFLNSYITAINTHDYAAYEQLFSPVVRDGQSAATFLAGYGTTTDSGVTLQSIGTVGAGELVAQVSFTSHQQPSGSATNSSCTAWTVSLYLLPQGGQYQLVPPPPGYQPSDSACS